MEKRYLLTGATGVVGSALLKQLVEHGDRVTLLIRADSEDHLDKRVKDLMEFCDVKKDNSHQINAMNADLYSPQFGLSRQDYLNLEENITHILHCAGNVNMGLSYDVAKTQTMAMTQNIVALMASGLRMEKMEYVSTVGVAGHTCDEIREEWITHEREFRNSYEAAKAAAEDFICEKVKSGLNITVHRPSMVVGDSKTGKNISFQVFYYLCEFFSGANSFGWVPNLKGRCLDLIPSDYVAKVIYRSSCQNKDLPRIMHLCSGPEGNIELNILSSWIREIFKSHGRFLPAYRQIPVGLYLALIFLIKRLVSKKTRRALSVLPVFFAYLKSPQTFANTQTRQWASRVGIELPDAMTYLEPVLGFYLEKQKQTKKKGVT